MVGKSLFEQIIEWEGSTWHLQYDPADDMSVVPDLSGGRIVNTSCTEVKLPNTSPDAHYYMVTVDIEIPAVMRGNEVRPAKQLKGFRIYDYMPPEPTGVASLRLPEMAFYIKEPTSIPVGGSAQMFLDTILGKTLAAAEKRDDMDRSWSKTLFAEEPEVQEETPRPQTRVPHNRNIDGYDR